MYAKHETSDRKKLYEETGNPLYAWHEIHGCILNDKSLPGWVLKYLEEVAFKFMFLRNPAANKKANREIIEALGFKNTSIFNLQDADDDFEFKYDLYKDAILHKIKKHIKLPKGETIEHYLARQVRCSAETINKWFKEVNDWINNNNLPLPHPFEDSIIEDMKEMMKSKMSKKNIILTCYYRGLVSDGHYQAPYPKKVFEEIFKKLPTPLQENGG